MPNLPDILQALQFGGAMVYPLLLLALVALLITFDKCFVYWRYVRLPATIRKFINTYHFEWDTLEKQIAFLGPHHYFGRFFRTILANRSRPIWWIESQASNEAKLIENALGRGLWILETIVTAAPLLGLLGTIAGMMHSFKLIGTNGLVDPTGVTGGIAQALIATGLGLLIAVIALFAFNFFSRRQTQVLDDMERLGTRLIDNLKIAS